MEKVELATVSLIKMTPTSLWDVSGFVRLFYISSKNEIFSHFPKNIPHFWPIIQFSK